VETLRFSCSLTVPQLGLSVASNELIVGGKRNPFANLFVGAQHRNASHEDTVKEKGDVSGQGSAEKAQGVFLHG